MDKKRILTTMIFMMGLLILMPLAFWALQTIPSPDVVLAFEPIDETHYQTLDPTPVPTTPPNASLITVGDPDVNGQAIVSAADGALPGSAGVAIINLSSGTLVTTTATSAGGFNTELFAPPGSALMIKYDPSGNLTNLLWNEAQSGADDVTYFTALPGTILNVGDVIPGSGEYLNAGFFGEFDGLNWAGWWLSGDLGGPGGFGNMDVLPGDTVAISGTLRITSPELNCTGTPAFTPTVNVDLRYLFDENGQTHPWSMAFVSHLFTPTGLPIEHEGGGELVGLEAGVGFTSMQCLSQFTAEGTLSVTTTIPVDLPEGLYQPELFLFDGGVPHTTSLPRVIIWYTFDPIARLPLVRVGDPAPPQIPWTLFGNVLSNGHRGVNALEDQGNYGMFTRTMFPPNKTVIPRFDERTGEAISYRLEPGSVWLSSNERRMPNPPIIPLELPGGELLVEVVKPDSNVVTIGPAPVMQSFMRTPTTPGGHPLHEGSGHLGDIYHLFTADDAFSYQFDQYGPHTITVNGYVQDMYGINYPIASTYEVVVARIMDLDPAQLPTTPYKQGDHFAPGLHVFPPIPANVQIDIMHLPLSNPDDAITTSFSGQANRYGYFQPPEAMADFVFDTPGEFRVDISATYNSPDGTLWAGYMTWGNVVEGTSTLIEAHGRRGMDYQGDLDPNDPPPTWFTVNTVDPQFIGKEIYYPYFQGDIHWGDETEGVSPGDSIHPVVTLKDLTGPSETIYNLMRHHYPRATNRFRWPPTDWSPAGLDKRLAVHEAPLFTTTQSGIDAAVDPEDIDLWSYWYGTSERPDVRVREIISEDGHGTGYWRFNDTYGYQIGEPADGDQPGDIKWEFGGAVFRTITETMPLNEYAIYSSLWVLLPQNDSVGARVTPPFRGAGVLDGGPIMTLPIGEGDPIDIDMLFLPKGVRPGDILELGDTFSFSGHVGPPLDSRVSITITTPSMNVFTDTWHANKIGWLYDPNFDFLVEETGRWSVEVEVHHDQTYPPTGINPDDPPYNGQYNHGTVLGTEIYNNTYEFYVVSPDAPRLPIHQPQSGFLPWPNNFVEPIEIVGLAPAGTTAVFYTIHDKGVVMGRGLADLDPSGAFTFIYDPEALHQQFSMLSLTDREGLWQGLADEVAINFLAVGTLAEPQANSVTLIGEEVFIGTDDVAWLYLPVTKKGGP